jgi:hypothetical protein
MSAAFDLSDGPLSVKVREPVEGLFYWVVTQLPAKEYSAGIRINASDHPYPTHEAALRAGQACLKALRPPLSI